MFVRPVIPIFDSFNTSLQAEEPLIHVLYHSNLRLYCSLLLRFILPEVISESEDVLSIDLKEPDISINFNSIFIATMTKQYATDSDTFGTKYLNKLIYTLVKLVLNPFILLILHSIFSTIRKICTDGRQNFRKRRYTRPCIY